MKFCGKTTCAECPWRKDVPTGRFPPERYINLADTCSDGDGLKPIFACHKTDDGKEQACVGYLLVEGYSNIVVRLASSRNSFNPEELESLGPLYDSFEELAIANGVPRRMLNWRRRQPPRGVAGHIGQLPKTRAKKGACPVKKNNRKSL